MKLGRNMLGVVLWAWVAYIALPCAATAKNLALLIGASNYRMRSLPPLKAPGNDVRLMWDTLRERGFNKEDIVVLADNFSPGGEKPSRLFEPTATNILRELDALAAQANEGDFVIVYFSGHGTIMRQSSPNVDDFIEPSGNNQVLLAIDAQEFDPIKGELKGGIVDKTLKKKFDELKKRAFVWVILDSCHSGGLTRDPDSEVKVHFVDPALLRVPTASNAKEVRVHAINPWLNQESGGKMVAFLAAPENRPSIEMPVAEMGGQHLSLFTYALVKALRSENYSSYRQLAQALLRAQVSTSGNVPTPVIEGDLDYPLFNSATTGLRRWLVEYDHQRHEIRLEAGALQGMRPGSIVAFERDGQLVSYGEIVSMDVSRSNVRLIEFNGQRPARPIDLSGTIATLAKPAVSFALKVALPPEKDMVTSESSRVGFAAIERLVGEKRENLPIEWATPFDRSADFHLRITGGAIYFVPKTGELMTDGRHRTPAVKIGTTTEATADEVRKNLWRALRQQNLRRIASEMRDDTGLAQAVEVQVRLMRDDAEVKRLAKNEKQSCKSWESSQVVEEKAIIIGGGAGNQLTHCDRIKIEILSRWSKSVDVTLLYLDSEGGISLAGMAHIPANRAHFSQKFQPINIVTWCGASKRCSETIGTEWLLVIVAEAEGESRWFDYLAQPGLARGPGERIVKRDYDGFATLMQNAALSPGLTRSAIDTAGDATIKIYQWEVVPPGEFIDR